MDRIFKIFLLEPIAETSIGSGNINPIDEFLRLSPLTSEKIGRMTILGIPDSYPHDQGLIRREPGVFTDHIGITDRAGQDAGPQSMLNRQESDGLQDDSAVHQGVGMKALIKMEIDQTGRPEEAGHV